VNCFEASGYRKFKPVIFLLYTRSFATKKYDSGQVPAVLKNDPWLSSKLYNASSGKEI
jgi:hypothetical protein